MKKAIDFIKKRYLIIVIAVAVFLLIGVFPKLEHKGTFSLNTTALSITCPETAVANETVTCSLTLSPVAKSYYSVNANYDLEHGGSFDFTINPQCVDGNGDPCFNTETENGFAMVASSLMESEYVIGSLDVTVPGDVVPGTNYLVKLINIELCDEDYNMESLADVQASIRIKNNDATLSNIVITDVALDKQFNSNIFEYAAEVSADIDEVNANATLNDSNATLAGSAIIGTLPLHYGTNVYQYIVTAEDGVTSETYTISIYRNYIFTLENSFYQYNEENNYIYTGSNNISMAISNLPVLGENLSYNANGNTLEIKYVDEVIKSINVINFAIDGHTVVDNKILLPEEISVGSFMNQITLNGVTAKMFDSNGDEIVDEEAMVSNTDHFKVYYSDSELADYTFQSEYLVFDDELVVDDITKTIKRLSINTTYADLTAKIETNGVYGMEEDNVQVSDDYKLKTGDKLVVTVGGEQVEYTISVVGCLDNEADVSLADVILLYRHLKGRRLLENEFLLAGDINNDGIIGLDDVIRLYRFFKGKIDTLEVE